jgi:hypothetical protein
MTPHTTELTVKEALEWQTMDTAPKTGEVIEISYGDGSNENDNCLARWSDRPVCMLGDRNGGHKPGWATAGPNVDGNLPLDPPKLWRYE